MGKRIYIIHSYNKSSQLMSKRLLFFFASIVAAFPFLAHADEAPLKADFTTANAAVTYYSQGFDSPDGMEGWTVGDGWKLANSRFGSIDANDTYSASIAYGSGEGGTTSQLVSPALEVEAGSKVEFYAYFSGIYLIWGSWQFTVTDSESGESAQLMDAFKWAQTNAYTGPNWNKFSFDLADYAGKKVTFAFVFSFGGEDLAVDGFRLTKPDPSAAEGIKVFEGESVLFSSTATGNPDSYEWSFPGGTIDGTDTHTSTEASPVVTYNHAGTYDVTLTVKRGDESDTMERKAFVTVAQKAPTAAIGLPEEGYESPYVGVFIPTGVPVTFRDLSTGGPTEWNWVFQNTDITTSTEQNPTVTYLDKGTFSVGLTAKNAAGQSNDILQYAIQAGGAQNVWNISTEENSSLEKVSLSWYGNYGGTNWLGLEQFAEKYKAPLADATIDSVTVFFASVTTIDPDAVIKLTVNTVAESGAPGEALATASVKASDLQYSDFDYLPTQFKFAEPVKIAKGQPFFVCVGPFPNGSLDESPYTADDIAIFCLRRGEGGKTTSWQLVEDQDDYGQSLGTYQWFENMDDPISMAIAPVVTYDAIATGVAAKAAAKAGATVEAIYNLKGQRVNAATSRGLYIIRYADGTSRKVSVE